MINTETMMGALLVRSIPREVIRLCSIRQEPLESWIKDAGSIPELTLNSLLMAEAFLQLFATGLRTLILVSATTVVLGGFSTKIRKEDFWYITVIGIIQTVKVFGSISGPKARFFVQFPAASMHTLISKWRRRGQVEDVTETQRGHVGDVTEILGVTSMVLGVPSMVLLPALFVAAPIYTAVACYMLPIIGLHGAFHNYGGTDTYTVRGNVKPALVVFYSLVLAQGTLLGLWCGVSQLRSDGTQIFSSKYLDFGIRNKKGTELVDRYITDTQDKCIEKGVFSITNRTLVSFAAELLQSEYHSDHESAVLLLHVLTTMEKRRAGAVKQISSSEQIVGSLFKLLRPKSPLDLDSKKETAEIVTKVACNLRLTDIPGAAHSISSLLDPQPRSMKTAANAGRPEPLAPGVRAICNAGCRRLLTELRKCKCLGATEARGGPSSAGETDLSYECFGCLPSKLKLIRGRGAIQIPTNNTNEGGARDKPLIVHGFMILDKLASDPGNCTEICKTTDLMPKILAPLTHGLLYTIGNDQKTIQTLEASLRVVAKLTSGTGESSTKLRRELVSEYSRATGNIMWIMKESSNEEKMRILAVEILTKLTLGVPRMCGFIADLKVLLLDHQDSPLRISAGKALSALAVNHCNREVIWEQVADDFRSLLTAMNDAGNSTVHRAVIAEFLAQICCKSKTKQARTRNCLISLSDTLPTVLDAIVIANKIAEITERRNFLASFLGLAVQIRENDLVTAQDFAHAVRELSMGIFCRFAEKLKEIIMEMTKEKESEDVICLVITKAAAKLVTWTMKIHPNYAYYFQQQNIVDKLQNIVKNAIGDLERCFVLRGDADEMEPPYETLQTLVEALESCLVAVIGGPRSSESSNV